MRHTGRNFALILALTAFTVSCDDDDDPTDPVNEEFTAALTGAKERPDPVTTTATGTASLDFTGTGAISYTVTVTGLSSAASGAHIHGPADANGVAQIIAPLTPLAAVTSGTLVTGTISTTSVSTISLDSLKVLLKNGNAYVNVHTANFPDGEIRGQVTSSN